MKRKCDDVRADARLVPEGVLALIEREMLRQSRAVVEEVLDRRDCLWTHYLPAWAVETMRTRGLLVRASSWEPNATTCLLTEDEGGRRRLRGRVDEVRAFQHALSVLGLNTNSDRFERIA